MANSSRADRLSEKGRLLKAQPLVAQPLGAPGPADAVPGTSIPVGPTPAGPIPVSGEPAVPVAPLPTPMTPSAGTVVPPAGAGGAPVAPATSVPLAPQPQPAGSAVAAPDTQQKTTQTTQPSESAGVVTDSRFDSGKARGPAALGAGGASAPVASGPGVAAGKPSGAARPVPVAAAPIVLSEEQKKARGAAVAQKRWKPGRKAVGAREELEELAEEGWLAIQWRNLIENHRSWAVSAIVHMVILIVLAVLTVGMPKTGIYLVASPEPAAFEKFDDLEDLIVEGPKVAPRGGDIVDRIEPEPLQPLIDMKNAAEGINAASVELIKMSIDKAPYNDLLCELGRGTGTANDRGTGKGRQGLGYGLNGDGMGLGGRGGRRGNALGDGATKESEESVDLALKWLAEHQLPDGSWSYNHQLAASCKGQCPNPGRLEQERIAATAMGVLPFLGAGHTHQVGKYKRTVAGGLNYLIANMKVGANGGAMNHMGGRMYAHGLATIALCEAYAMQVNPRDIRKLDALHYDGTGESPGEKSSKKKDEIEEIPVPGLGRAAQLALNFVMYAQDPNMGGWRYEPKQAGDSSVVGWQLMALVSGRLGMLNVNPNSILGAIRFLDFVQMDDYGANYGYTDKTRGTDATQAIGLLCRMYTGWKHDHPGLLEGCRQLSQRGPLQGSMYYNYYATQVLHHFGGPEWEQWNPRMRDSLVASQSKAGHTAGSWYWGGPDHGAGQGGRLYYTSLAAMTLEVYYRHMPLYKKDVLEGKAEKPDEKKEPEKERPVDEF